MQLQPIMSRMARTTSAQRQEWLQKFFSSGLSRQDFAREHGLKFSTLCRWLAQTQDAAQPIAKPVVFKEVVALPAKVPDANPVWTIEILTPAGLVLHLR